MIPVVAALQEVHAGGEASLILPDLGSVEMLGMDGRTLLLLGLLVCGAGLAFGMMIYSRLKALEVHRSMREVSELIYETCKTYLGRQVRFIAILELFIGAIIVIYFGVLRDMSFGRVAI